MSDATADGRHDEIPTADDRPAASLADLLLDHPLPDDAPLVHTADRSVTAGAARASCRGLAALLAEAGVAEGTAVAVMLPSGPEAVVAMFAVWAAGAVLVPVNPRHPAPEVDHLLDATDPAAFVGPPAEAARLAARCSTVTPADDLGWEVAARVEPSRARRYEPGTALVLFTSGTTGRPKALLHGHAEYLEIVDRVQRSLRAGADRDGRAGGSGGTAPMPNLVPVSLALNAGLYNVLFAFRAGAPVVLLERFDTATFAALVRRFGIRSTVLPPAAIAMLADDAAVDDLGPLRYVRSITAPLPPGPARRFAARFDVVVLNGYGQAEIGEVIGWTAAQAREWGDRKLGAAGRPHPGVDVRVLADDGRPVADGGVGELWVRPPSRSRGYVGEAGTGSAPTGPGGLGERLSADGFVRTGDLARLDDDGFVWIEGRVSDVVNRGGNKVFPAEVEDVVRGAPGVRDVAVVGVPDERLGEVPVAFVVGDEPLDVDALTSRCRAALAPYKVPVRFEAVESIPRSEVGKVLRARLVP